MSDPLCYTSLQNSILKPVWRCSVQSALQGAVRSGWQECWFAVEAHLLAVPVLAKYRTDVEAFTVTHSTARHTKAQTPQVLAL